MLLPWPLLPVPDLLELTVSVLDAAGVEDESALAHAAAQQASGPITSGSSSVRPGWTRCYRQGSAFACLITFVENIPMEVATARAFEQMRDAARRDGVTLRAVSGFRTMEHQRALYAAYLAHTGPLAARPGYSAHQSGHALDLNTPEAGVLAWLNRHAATYGFRRTIRAEGWHWERGGT